MKATQPYPRFPHQTVVNAIATVSPKHQSLLDEYRTALRLWTEARALYPDSSPAVIAATSRLEEIEQDLREYQEG